VSNLTSNISESTFVGALNITLPALTKVPGLGKSTKSIIDLVSGIVKAVFVIAAVGNALSIILSVVLFFIPSQPYIPLASASITTLSTQLLQISAFTSTFLSIGLSSAINGSSEIFGVSASIGGKFLGLVWVAYLCAQAANVYWVNVWFVKFRTVAFKRRARSESQKSAGYKAILGEVRGDFSVDGKDEGEEVLIQGTFDIKHWNESYGKI